jgi:hypothetical protein
VATSSLPAPSRNLPAIRTPATVVRTQPPAPLPRLGPVARTVLMGTAVAAPFAGLMLSLVGGTP